MTETQIIIDDGKNNLLNTGFTGTGSSLANSFSLMAAGKSTNSYDSDSHGLGAECTSADGNYFRAPISITPYPTLNRIDIEGIFDTTNITNTTTITEIGIVDNQDPGTFYCLCQLPPMTKNSSNQLRIVVTVLVD
jgi:hypothetical protein